MVFLFGVFLYKHNVMNVCLCRVLITCQAESKMCVLPPFLIFFLVIRLHLYSFLLLIVTILLQKRVKISIVFVLFYSLCNLYTKLRQNIYKKIKILNM